MTPTHIQRILDKLESVRELKPRQWEALCPAHPDSSPSLSIGIGKDDRGLLNCHAGCTSHAVLQAIGFTYNALYPDSTATPERIVATYPYVDEAGVLLFEVVRFTPKTFRPRQPDGRWTMDGVRRVLYRLPELIASTDLVLIVGGEKDVDSLRQLGFTATCNPGGEGKWKSLDDDSAIAGRNVVLIADRDTPGRSHVADVAARLIGRVASIKCLELPGASVKDSSDWIAAGGTALQLRGLIAQAGDTLAAPAISIADDDGIERNATLRTDIGNAARFVIRNRDKIRYCAPWDKFLIYRAGRWAVDERREADKLAMQTALAIYDELRACPDDQREALAKWAMKSHGRDRLAAMLALAKPSIAVVPSDFDADPWLLNVQNGTVDTRTAELRPHAREDFITKICRATYDLNATCPVFDAFLARIFRTHPELAGYARKAAGYAATGSIREQVLFFLHGEGANGKTTLLDAIMYVLGDYAGKADRELMAASDRGAQHPTNIADLMGRRLVVCSETNEGGRLDEAKLKDLVGESRLKARYMGKDFFEFKATHKVFLYSNHRPVVRGTDHGMWRRMRLIPFVETIQPEEKDGTLPAKLESEANGILSWIIGGCLLWQRDGLGLPDEVAQATNAYRIEMDTIGVFLNDRCFFRPRLDVGATALYQAYRKFCDDTGEHPLTQTRMGRQLAGRPNLSKRRDAIGRYVWSGIGLREGTAATPDI